jgi:hypothetical protein
LKGVDENAILIFSGVGIIIYELKVKRRSDLSTMRVRIKATSLEEIVINKGY